MNLKYTQVERSELLSRYKSGEKVSQIHASTGIPKSTIYAWIKEERTKSESTQPQLTQRQFRTLTNKVARLEGIIEILHRINCSANAPLSERLQAIVDLQGQYSIHMLCDALKVPTGTYYNHVLRNKKENAWYVKWCQELREKVQRVFDDSNQVYGAGKIVAVLRKEGCNTSEKTVREIMKELGLKSIREGSKATYRKENRHCKNYVNQQFKATRPNEIWVSDVTQIRINNETYFICIILDLYARRVVGYKIGLKNSTQLIKSCFKSAWEIRSPSDGLTLHTDRGGNYRAKAFTDYMSKLNVIHSYSRPHVPYDNSVAESFFASLKREELYRTKYRSEREFRTAVNEYIEIYNTVRPHSSNRCKAPAEKEQEYYEKNTP